MRHHPYVEKGRFIHMVSRLQATWTCTPTPTLPRPSDLLTPAAGDGSF